VYCSIIQSFEKTKLKEKNHQKARIAFKILGFLIAQGHVIAQSHNCSRKHNKKQESLERKNRFYHDRNKKN